MSDKRNCSVFTTIFLFTLIALFLTGLASAETVIGFSPAQLSVQENEEFTLAITIETDTNVSGAELELSYDPSLVNIASITEGDFFKQGGMNTIFSRGNIDNELGTVSGIYSVIMGDDMLLAPGNFATITLSSKGVAGITYIEMKNVIITNSTGASLPVTINNAKVIIGDVETSTANEETTQSQQSGQNTIIPLVFAIMCLYFVKRK
ncbi:cohesin domain-containing protein [Methanolobus mangrovi]|uniref:Cohesin domain-containing protein n=1 Tax=Methanolobus mangrovi TaxID=3072977 RepID=A0AA51UE74_9EURY|nr:cohesin domain-containing protein [Methanolobus mangrovi]WMW21535.1 cohesin domain-containing protein [Methanolobus mangrovi]